MSPTRDAPHDPRAEEALLGAMMLARRAVEETVLVLRAGDFYSHAHNHIYAAIVALYGEGVEVDPITVAAKLEQAGTLETVGGAGALVALQADTPAISNAKRYALMIEHNAVLRRMIGAAGEIAELGYSLPEDPYSALDAAQQLLFDVRGERGTGSLLSARAMLEDTLDRLEQLAEQGGEHITGMPTGFLDLDELTSGLQPGAVTVLGARPGMGKTALALGIAAHASMVQGRTVLFREFEGSHGEVMGRLLASEARVDSTRIRNGRLQGADWDRINAVVERIALADLWVDDSSTGTALDVRAQARQVQARSRRLDCVVVDHVGLMEGPGSNDQERTAGISRALKVLAKDLHTHVLVLSQLNRSVEQRSDKRPTLSDLRSSGSLEQDADNVFFLYRDEVYYRDSLERGTAELLVAKQRDGQAPAMIRLAFLGYYTRFANMARARG